jgi:zinc transporter ZupT
VADDPIAVGVTSSTGIETVHEIPAAVETPTASPRGFLGYGLIGALVGVLPVALGLLWLPALRRTDPRWLAAFMSLTAGLLSFLGVGALFEAFSLQAGLPAGLGGPGLVLLGVAVAVLGMTFLSHRLSRGRGALQGVALAFLVALGIGVHNLGEGLAIGTSFAFGELQLGTLLVVGFMVHNLTEGLAIAVPAADERPALLPLVGLALVAGAPAILGTWIGGYTTSDVLGVLFFGIAAGAALQVVVEVGKYVRRRAPGGLTSGWAIGGFLTGIAVMWATGLLIG